MTAPETLSRPLAARTAALPEPTIPAPAPDIPPAVIEAAVAALDEGKTHYTDRPGILPLRTWVTAYLKKHCQLELQPDAVTITCGGTEARFVTIKKLVAPGKAILCPGDATRIAPAAKLVGVEIVTQVDDLAAISLVYLTPQDDQQTRDALLEQASINDWWIAWDVSGGIGSTGFHPAQNADLATRVITIGSLSAQIPGWRMGWLAGSEMAGKLRAYKQSMTICSTSVSQWAALGLVDEL